MQFEKPALNHRLLLLTRQYGAISRARALLPCYPISMAAADQVWFQSGFLEPGLPAGTTHRLFPEHRLHRQSGGNRHIGPTVAVQWVDKHELRKHPCSHAVVKNL